MWQQVPTSGARCVITSSAHTTQSHELLLLMFASVLLSLNMQTQRAHTQMGTAGWKRKIDWMCERLPLPVISAQSMRHMTTLWEAWNYSRAYVKAPLGASFFFFFFFNCTNTQHGKDGAQEVYCTLSGTCFFFLFSVGWINCFDSRTQIMSPWALCLDRKKTETLMRVKSRMWHSNKYELEALVYHTSFFKRPNMNLLSPTAWITLIAVSLRNTHLSHVWISGINSSITQFLTYHNYIH